MVLLIILLFVLGVIAVILEVIVPHGISAVIGFILIGISGYFAIHDYGWQLGGMYLLFALATACIVAYYATRLSRRYLTLSPTQRKPTPQAKAAAAATTEGEPSVGDEARVVQPLRPTGTIEWAGKRLPARSLSPEVVSPLGASVVIRGRDSTFWLVEEKSAAQS